MVLHGRTTSVARGTRARVRPATVAALATGAALGLGMAGVQAAAAYGDLPRTWFGRDDATGLSLELLDAPEGAHAVQGDQVAVPAALLDGLVPGDVRTFQVAVTNDAHGRQTVVSRIEWLAPVVGEPFAQEPLVEVVGLPGLLEPGARAAATVRVLAPEDWSQANAGRSGRLVVTFTGTQS